VILAVTSSSLPLLVAIGTTIFASVTGPLVVVLILARQQRKGKELDWEREDERDAQKKQEAEERAEKAAAQLLAANEEIATHLAETNGQTQDRLDGLDAGIERVHTLVNSDKTAAMQRDLDSAKEKLVLLGEIADLKHAAGLAPKPETLGEIESTERRITELQAELDDRHRQADLAEQQMKKHE